MGLAGRQRQGVGLHARGVSEPENKELDQRLPRRCLAIPVLPILALLTHPSRPERPLRLQPGKSKNRVAELERLTAQFEIFSNLSILPARPSYLSSLSFRLTTATDRYKSHAPSRDKELKSITVVVIAVAVLALLPVLPVLPTT